MECTCGRGAMIEITMSVREHAVTFRRCASCERQGWTTDGDQVPLERVLVLARAAA